MSNRFASDVQLVKKARTQEKFVNHWNPCSCPIYQRSSLKITAFRIRRVSLSDDFINTWNQNYPEYFLSGCPHTGYLPTYNRKVKRLRFLGIAIGENAAPGGISQLKNHLQETESGSGPLQVDNFNQPDSQVLEKIWIHKFYGKIWHKIMYDLGFEIFLKAQKGTFKDLDERPFLFGVKVKQLCIHIGRNVTSCHDLAL